MQSGDLAPWPAYLSGWLGMAGLGDLHLQGAISSHVRMQDGGHGPGDADCASFVIDAQQRFASMD